MAFRTDSELEHNMTFHWASESGWIIGRHGISSHIFSVQIGRARYEAIFKFTAPESMHDDGYVMQSAPLRTVVLDLWKIATIKSTHSLARSPVVRQKIDSGRYRCTGSVA